MKSLENDVVQYIIVRKDLLEDLDFGFLAAQVAHASLAPITKQLQDYYSRNQDKSISKNYGQQEPSTNYAYDMLDASTRKWVNGKFTKILLEVKDKEDLITLAETLKENGISYTPIKEESLGRELTAIGIKPYKRSEVSPYLKDLQILKKRDPAVKGYVNNISIDPSRMTYSIQDINSQEIDRGNRFILQVSIDHLANRFGSKFGIDLERYRSHGGTGDDFIDHLADTDLIRNLGYNDPRFNRFLLTGDYESLLKNILPKGIRKDIVITSLDGIFTDSKNINIYGGCHI